MAPEIQPADIARVLSEVRRPGARLVLVNVWASWCVPCREEFPEVLAFVRAHEAEGVRPVLVSADFDEQLPDARAFLKRNGVTFVTYLKTGEDTPFIDALDPRWTGALPATFLYDGNGKLQFFHEGKVTRALLEEQGRKILGASSSSLQQEERS
jgi:thiol-disulfide isomerase/thioredoxin